MGCGIEHSEIRRLLCSTTQRPLPAEGIVGKVDIHQRVPEPTRAILARNHQVLDEKLATIIPTLFGFETISCLVVFWLATDDPFIFGPTTMNQGVG